VRTRNIFITSTAAVIAAVAIGSTGAQAAGVDLFGSNDIQDDSVRSIDVKDQTLRLTDLRPGAVEALSGGSGAQGPQGEPGAPGEPGPAGKDAQALPYGIAQVKVQRGTGAASPWAVYSTTIGSPVGDTTGGTFRFTCTDAQAPCKVSLAGYATKDGATVYPRLDIQKQSMNGGSQTYCEYADGPASGALSSSPTALTLHIGSSDDCGLNGPAGALNEITVPAGYYDVTSTFQFTG
jgi:hypothetical protein